LVILYINDQTKQNEFVINDDLLKIKTSNRPITLAVRTGSGFLEYAKSARNKWPEEAYENVLIEADGLIFHLNPLQEVIQPGGGTKTFLIY